MFGKGWRSVVRGFCSIGLQVILESRVSRISIVHLGEHANILDYLGIDVFDGAGDPEKGAEIGWVSGIWIVSLLVPIVLGSGRRGFLARRRRF